MTKPDHDQLEEMRERYPTDPCRQIATYVLEAPDLPDEDRLCAAGILNALEAAEHARDLTVVEVGLWQLRAAAVADAERLWDRYEEREPNES